VVDGVEFLFMSPAVHVGLENCFAFAAHGGVLSAVSSRGWSQFVIVHSTMVVVVVGRERGGGRKTKTKWDAYIICPQPPMDGGGGVSWKQCAYSATFVQPLT
jgi:hypothetical protein